jgi:uncharacterized protein
VRVQDETGRWIVYNSMTGALGAIPKGAEDKILPLFRDGHEGLPANEVKGLVARGFLVPQHEDELKKAERLKERRLSFRGLHLILMPTEECNFRCKYCYEDFARGRMPARVREGVKNLVRRSVKELERLEVGWFGGEPMEEMGVIEEISHELMGLTAAAGVPYSANIVTNGFHLNEDNLRRLLAAGVDRIQVTLDGLAAQHDSQRVTRAGHPTFDTIWKNLQSAKRLPERFKLSVRVNFNARTLIGLDSFLAQFSQEFASDDRFSLMFRPVGHWGGPNDDGVEVCTARDGEIAQFTSAKRAHAHGIRSGGTFPFLLPHGSVCYAANPRSFVIGSDGTLYKCTVALKKDFNKVGRLRPDGDLELDEARFKRWVEADDRNDSVCQACSFRPACQGAACPLERIERNGS